jgi:dTMP kinase
VNTTQINNRLIVFEGIDGSGKSTQAKLLADQLIAEGCKVYSTFEPTKSRIGSIIRDIFTHKMEADHQTIAALFLADRLDHIQNKETGMLKKLEEGYTVICDRYYFSSYAYHGVHVDIDWVIQANSLCASLLRPAMNIFIDVLPQVAMQRINTNRDSVEIYETLENLTNVREKYVEAFEKQKHAEQICIIDGNRTEEAIAANVWAEVKKLFQQ